MRTHDDAPLSPSGSEPRATDPGLTHAAQITVDQNGLGVFWLDGAPITNVRGFALESRAGQQPLLTIQRFLTAGHLKLEGVPVEEIVVCPGCGANKWRGAPDWMLYNVLRSVALFQDGQISEASRMALELSPEEAAALPTSLPEWQDLSGDQRDRWSRWALAAIKGILQAVAVRQIVNPTK